MLLLMSRIRFHVVTFSVEALGVLILAFETSLVR